MNAAKSHPHLAKRPVRPQAPPLPDYDRLDNTHRQVMLALERLKQLVAQLELEGVNDDTRAIAAEICEFFDGHARAHHAAEEQAVFPPLLRSSDAELVHHVKRLQQDHGWLEEDWLELQPQLRAVAEGYTGFDHAFLQAAIPVFTDLYREHIALEEDVVYPASRQQAG
jgi:hemerythrin-like domain-containing protein